MSRMPRFFVPHVPLHVIQRGNDRSAIFLEDRDYSFFGHTLRRAATAHGVAIHAYVLMTNHVHLLATPLRAESMPKTMQSLGRVYVAHFNGKYGRTGTRWEGRYKAAAVQDDSYLLTCMRYIEFNPVRAGMVTEPRAYAWSSYVANAFGGLDPIVTPHSLYLGLGASDVDRHLAYRDLCGTSVTPQQLHVIRDATQNAWAMGDGNFKQAVSEQCRRATRLRVVRPRKGTTHIWGAGVAPKLTGT